MSGAKYDKTFSFYSYTLKEVVELLLDAYMEESLSNYKDGDILYFPVSINGSELEATIKIYERPKITYSSDRELVYEITEIKRHIWEVI